MAFQEGSSSPQSTVNSVEGLETLFLWTNQFLLDKMFFFFLVEHCFFSKYVTLQKLNEVENAVLCWL